MSFVLILQHIHLKEHIGIISHVQRIYFLKQFKIYIDVAISRSRIDLLYGFVGITFREHNNQNKHSDCIS